MLQHYSANSWSKSEKPVCDALRPAICATIRRLVHSVPRAENQKKGLNQIWMRNKGFSASFSFSAQHFPILDFHTGSRFPFIPQEQDYRRKWNSPNLSETKEFQCQGHSNWTICILLSSFCPRWFSTFSLSYWDSNSYYPRGLIMGKGKFFQLPI